MEDEDEFARSCPQKTSSVSEAFSDQVRQNGRSYPQLRQGQAERISLAQRPEACSFLSGFDVDAPDCSDNGLDCSDNVPDCSDYDEECREA